MMKVLLVLIACIFCQHGDAKQKPFSPRQLTEFYDDFVCEQKQELASAQLTGGCVVFWVSTEGSDANPGTEQKPFLTLHRARDAVRALPPLAFKDQDVRVYIKEGTYRLQEPLVLTSKDSGRYGRDVVYSAA